MSSTTSMPATTTFTGSVRSIRQGRAKTFIDMAYGKTRRQVVIATTAVPQSLPVFSVVSVTGELVLMPVGRTSVASDSYELHASSITVVSLADEHASSVCPTGASAATRMAARTSYFMDSIFSTHVRLSTILTKAIAAYFDSVDAMQIKPPLITGTECEGGATLFSLKYPGATGRDDLTAYLTQSSQFALEYSVPSLGDVYCIADSFRAEKSQTRRHLCEFEHAECEWGFVADPTTGDGIARHMDKLLHMIRGIIDKFIEFGESELKYLTKARRTQDKHATDVYERVLAIQRAVEKDPIYLSHAEAIVKCREYGLRPTDVMAPIDGEAADVTAPQREFGDREDIPEAAERALVDRISTADLTADEIAAGEQGRLVFLHTFPREFKSFYMAQDAKDPTYVQGCDVEVHGVGEIIGSGVREADAERLTARMLEQGLKLSDYTDYIALRKSAYHYTSGMGLGVGRILCWLLDVKSIRDVVQFPRVPGYVYLG